MQTSTLQASLKKKTSRVFYLSFILLFISASSHAQRSYSLIYSENLKGNTTMFGNTLLHIVNNSAVNLNKMNDNSANGNSTYGNDQENMQYVDIDGNTGEGAVTRNSSSADLILPAGTNTIKLARLYWGGRINYWDFNLDSESNRTIKIRKGNVGAYFDVTALGIDESSISWFDTEYQAYADITTLVKQLGAGTYTVGNVPLSTGSISGGGSHGGWAIVVVYENEASNYNSVRIYDGFQKVYDDGAATVSTVTLSGLDVPSGTLDSGEAKMGVMSWEGDANLGGDFLKINEHLFSNATNQEDNPWNGTITDNGVHVTTKNPNYTNQMGVDIDIFNVGAGYGILPNASKVTLEFGTEADQYYPGVFTFAIKMKNPTITLDKLVSDDDNNRLAEPGETLTYTLQGKNMGAGNANQIEVIDTLPNTVTYVPQSLKVINSPGIIAGSQTDAAGDDFAEYISNGSTNVIKFRLGAGAGSTAGGTLASGETYKVEFQVKVKAQISGEVPSIMNIARVSSKSDANVSFVDDGTVIINPVAGPMPVTLEKFTAQLISNDRAQIQWATSMEINCRKFVVETSLDGFTFTDGQSVAGNGTTALFNEYSVIGNIPATAGNVVYYRLKQIDLDGKENFSEVITLKLKRDNQILSVSPNPFSSYINVNIKWSKSETITARIINIQGKEVVSKSFRVSKGDNSLKIDNLSMLPSGNYFIQFISPSERLIQKISK